MYRHCEVHRPKFFVLEETTHSIKIRRCHEAKRAQTARTEVLPSEEWIGTTLFPLLRIRSSCLKDSKSKILQNTTRPDTICPEEWPRPCKKQKKEEIANWHEETTRLQEDHRDEVIFHVASEDEDYLQLISAAQAKLEQCVVPPMPRTCKRRPCCPRLSPSLCPLWCALLRSLPLKQWLHQLLNGMWVQL